jgi:hypothetical protein
LDGKTEFKDPDEIFGIGACGAEIPKECEGSINRIEGILKNKKSLFDASEFKSSRDMVDDLAQDWNLTLGQGRRYHRCITRLVASDLASGPSAHGEQLYFDAHQFRLNQARWAGGRRKSVNIRGRGETPIQLATFAMTKMSIELLESGKIKSLVGEGITPSHYRILRSRQSLNTIRTFIHQSIGDLSSDIGVVHDWDSKESRVRGIIGILQTLWQILTKQERLSVLERVGSELSLSPSSVLKLIMGNSAFGDETLSSPGFDLDPRKYSTWVLIKQSVPQVQAICSALCGTSDANMLADILRLNLSLRY